MPAIRALTIHFTDDQIDGMGPVRAKLREIASEGCPGMMLAQVFSDHMRVFVIDNDQARKFQEILGQPVGKTTEDVTAEILAREQV